MKGNKEGKNFNVYLDSLKTRLYDCHKNLLDNHPFVTAESMRNAFSGNGEKPRLLINIFKAHNQDIEKLLGKGFSKPTYTKYETTLNHLESFLKWKYRISDINLTHLSYEFLSDFEFYIKTEKNIDHNTTTKYIKNAKKVVKECHKKKWIKENPLEYCTIKMLETETTFLFNYELSVIQSKVFKSERICQARDVFVFSCYTGPSFIDAYNLTPDDISIGIDGQKWIFTHRQNQWFLPTFLYFPLHLIS